MARADLIDKLNECLRHEWTGVAQYAQAGFVVSGLWREVYSPMFFNQAEESFRHARLVGQKIAALGGAPTVQRNPIRQSGELAEMLQCFLEFESAAVQLYTEAIALAGDDRALQVFLEDILKEEQQGADELGRLLESHRPAGDASELAATGAG